MAITPIQEIDPGRMHDWLAQPVEYTIGTRRHVMHRYSALQLASQDGLEASFAHASRLPIYTGDYPPLTAEGVDEMMRDS